MIFDLINYFVLFSRKLFEDNQFSFFSVLVPAQDGKEESTNTFLSSSLQQSPSNDSLTKEEIPVVEKSKEIINQTISTIVADEEHHEIEQNEQSTPDISEENKEESKEIMCITPSSGLNPEATPFVGLSTVKVERTQSTSTGDESDDEHDSNETPVTTGKS